MRPSNPWDYNFKTGQKLPTQPEVTYPEPKIEYPEPKPQETNDSMWARWLEQWGAQNQQQTDLGGSAEWWNYQEEYPEQALKPIIGAVPRAPGIFDYEKEFLTPDIIYPTQDLELLKPKTYENVQFGKWLAQAWDNITLAVMPQNIREMNFSKGGGLAELAYLMGDWEQGFIVNDMSTRKPNIWPTVLPRARNQLGYMFGNIMEGKIVQQALIFTSLATRYLEGLGAELNYFGREISHPIQKVLTAAPMTNPGGSAFRFVGLPRVYNKKESALLQGTYPEQVSTQVIPPTMDYARHKLEYDIAVKSQTEFTKIFNEAKTAGRNEEDAVWEAMKAVNNIEKAMSGGAYYQRPFVFGGEITDNNPLGFTPELLEAAKYARGYRRTHAINAEAYKRYVSYVESGMDPVQAGDLTEDPVFENLMLTIVDFQWIMGKWDPSQVFIQSVWKGGVKPVAKGLGFVALHIPGLNHLFKFAIEIDVKTVGNYAARNVRNTLDIMQTAAAKSGGTLSPEVFRATLQDPTSWASVATSKYGIKAFKGTVPYIDEVYDLLKKRLGTAGIDKAVKDLITEHVAKGMRAAPETVLREATRRAVTNAIEEASIVAYKKSGDLYLLAHPTVAAIQSNPIYSVAKRLMGWNTNLKGLQVDMWLSARPSWNIFNYVDNAIKLLVDGKNPFQNIPNMLKRYSNYVTTATTPEALEAVVELRKLGSSWNPLDLFNTKKNLRYVELLKIATEAQVPGVYGLVKIADMPLDVAIKKLDLRNIVRQFPGMKQWMAWNNSWAARIEESMNVRLFMQTFFDNYDEGIRIIKNDPVAATIGGISRNVNPAIAAEFKARLGALSNPTIADVDRLIAQMVDRNRLVSAVPNLVDGLGNGVKNLSPDIVAELQQSLNRLAIDAANGGLTRASIDAATDRIARKLVAEADGTLPANLRAASAGLPDIPLTSDDMYNALLPNGANSNLADLYEAQRSLPSFAQRAKAEDALRKIEHWQDAGEAAKKFGEDSLEYSALHDAYFLAERPAYWNHILEMQDDTLRRILTQADDYVNRLKAVDVTPPPGIKPLGAGAEGIVAKINSLNDEWIEAKRVLDAALAEQRALEAAGDVGYSASLPAADARKALRKIEEELGMYGATPGGVVPVPSADLHVAESALQIGREKLIKAQQALTDLKSRMVYPDYKPIGNESIAQLESEVANMHSNINALTKRVSDLRAAAQVVPPIPSTYALADQIRVAGQARNDVFAEMNKKWRQLYRDTLPGGAYAGKYDEAYALVNEETYNMMQAVRVPSDDAAATAYRGIDQWFKDHGVAQTGAIGGLPQTQDPGWWRISQQIDDAITGSNKNLQTQLYDLRAIRDDIYANRVNTANTMNIGVDDTDVLQAYGSDLKVRMQALYDDSFTKGIDAKHRMLFDYETTQNWQRMLGQIFPFTRFPIKNIPLWLDKFSEIPHFATSVQHIRMVQSAINQQKYGPNMPERYRYTVELPFSKEILKLFGLDNMALRVNPWNFLSFIKYVPGGTPFGQRQLEEIMTNEATSGVTKAIGSFQQTAENLGLGMWPTNEWILGSMGFLGPNWYPQDALGTWTPVVNWAMNTIISPSRVGGAAGVGTPGEFGTVSGRGMWDVDYFMRTTVTNAWNSAWRGVPFMQWSQVNPDLFREMMLSRNTSNAYMKLPDIAAASLVILSPTQAKETVKLLSDSDYDAIAKKIQPIFEMTAEQQAEAIPLLNPAEQAVFLDQIELRAMRLTISEQLVTTLMGHTMGLYVNFADEAEIEAADLRYQKKKQEQALPPGPERRSGNQQFLIDHPQMDLIYNYSYANHPWAELASGYVAEQLDSTISDFKSQYFDTISVYSDLIDRGASDIYRQYPGDMLRVKDFKNMMRDQQDEKLAELNEELNSVIAEKIAAYRLEFPNDYKGIEALLNGFETQMYVGIQLNEDERKQLNDFAERFPEDREGYDRLYKIFVTAAEARKPDVQTKKVPGFAEGYNLNLKWSPIDNPNYTAEEITDIMVGRLLQDLYDNKPIADDSKNTTEFYDATQKYLSELPALALKTPQVQEMIVTLIKDQGMTQEEATSLVSSWFTKDELYANWRKNDTPWDALEYVYQWHYITDADTEFYDVIQPLRYTDVEGDWQKAEALYEDLIMRFDEIPAQDLVKYIIQDYPGKWTLAELTTLFEGITMPSYATRSAIRVGGENAVDKHIRYYYDMLDADGKKSVREAFGVTFSDVYLKEAGAGKVSLQQKGVWMDALAVATGNNQTWRDLPGIDQALKDSVPVKEAVEFGLPVLPVKDEEEFAQAQEINLAYWNAVVAGDTATEETLQNDPLRIKWFGNASSKSYFWYVYYTTVPYGPFSKQLKNDPFIARLIKNKDPRYTVALNSDFDRAVDIMKNWVEDNQIAIDDAGLDPSEYAEVGKLGKAYYEIPPEDKSARKQFLADNPLLQKYFDAGELAPGTAAIGFGAGGYAPYAPKTPGVSKPAATAAGRAAAKPVVDYRLAWSSLKADAGQSISAVLRMLTTYWNTGVLTPAADKYLRALHTKLGGDIAFEDWLEALKKGWLTSTSTGAGIRIGAPKAPPKPQYGKGSSGIRRI